MVALFVCLFGFCHAFEGYIYLQSKEVFVEHLKFGFRSDHPVSVLMVHSYLSCSFSCGSCRNGNLQKYFLVPKCYFFIFHLNLVNISTYDHLKTCI